jgi:hypothetical protein
VTTWIRKPIVWGHRYLGVGVSLLFLMWFLSGIGMIYSRGMPRLTPEMRLARLAPLDLDEVRVSPAEAASIVRFLPDAREVTLSTVLDRPAYRFSEPNGAIVFADTGEFLNEFDRTHATSVAASFLGVPEAQVRIEGVLTSPDQWTLTQSREMPMYKLAAADGRGTEVYVSATAGEVVQFTTSRGRLLAWVSVIPHFMYFKALRMNGGLWNGLMTWGPGISVIVALLGIVLGLIYFPRRAAGRLLPFRGGLRWHYALGLVFGIVTLSFVSSGLVSMEPWGWTTADDSLAPEARRLFPDRTGDLSDFPAIDRMAWESALSGAATVGVQEIAFVRIADEPHFVARSASRVPAVMGWPDGGHQPYFVERTRTPQRIILDGELQPRTELTADALRSRIEESIPGVHVVESDRLTSYDAYYYSRENRSPLPVLRAKLDDPDQTWLYIDPGLERVVGNVNGGNRIERWVYAGLHTFDFPFLYGHRPLWDAILIAFCLGGAALSGLGVLLGFRRLGRGLERFTRPRHA